MVTLAYVTIFLLATPFLIGVVVGMVKEMKDILKK
jgi:hypothetical protein